MRRTDKLTHMTNLSLALGFCTVAAAAGCNSFDAPPAEGSGTVRVAPTDVRAPVSGELPAAPVMGSNLLALRASPSTVMVSDADRSRVSFVQSNGSAVHVATGKGTLPNRSAEDSAGFVHVALRGTGELAMISPAGSLVARNQICEAPRGVAFDPTAGEVVVACAEGKLVHHSIDPNAYQTVRTVPTDVDVRDVVVLGAKLYVSRLRSAEVLEYQGDALVKRHTLPTVELQNGVLLTERAGSRFKPTVAWKMVASPEGDSVVVLHQRSLLNVVGDDAPAAENGDESDNSGSSYGGSSDPASGCGAIVQPAVSEIHSDGSVLTSDSVAGVVLAVDMVPQGRFINGEIPDRPVILASAGVLDPDQPKSETISLQNGEQVLSSSVDLGFAPGMQRSGVSSAHLQMHASEQTNPRTGDVVVGCTPVAETFSEQDSPSPTVSVAQLSSGELVALQRDANVLLRGNSGFFEAGGMFELGGESVRSTGHDLFHRDSGGGIACASCHPEAEDDGHVWDFASVGRRKTQFLGVPLQETAPFHWDGTLSNLDSLMDEVFVTRMGGVFQSEARVKALGDWLGETQPMVASAKEVDASAERGKALFYSEEVACGQCHSGNALTDNKSYDVGTSTARKLQTPSLTHLALHPPFMHNGCAVTLRDRFEPSCGGGDAHGKTSHLSAGQIDDLVAYLATL